jgi:hypothetical protein
MTTDWKDWRVADTDINKRVKTVLMANDPAMTWQDVLGMSERDLSALPHMGKTNRAHLLDILRDGVAGKLVKCNRTLGEVIGDE